MKKLNTLKLIVAIVMACLFNANAQTVNDAFWNSTTSNAKDVGEAIAWDPVHLRIYVAGEQNTGLAGQSVRIIKYNETTELNYKRYDSAYFYESAKQLIFRNNKLYLIGNAVDTSGISTMFLLRLNTSLGVEKVKWFTTSKYSNPVKAVFVNSELYIACYKKVSGVDKFAMLEVDTNFNIITSNVPSDTTYKRTPKDLVSANGSLYVVGSAKSGTFANTTSCFAMKFATALTLTWEHYGSSSALSQNGYNTVAVTSNAVFVGGSEFNLNDQRWVMRKLNKNTGAVSITHRTGGSNFSGDIGSVVKITLATADSVFVTGYVKNQSLNTFTIKSAKYNSSLGSFLAANANLDYDTKLNDAIAWSDGSWSIATGRTKIGTDYGFFFTEFSNYKLQVSGGQTAIYRNAGGNKIIWIPGGYSYAAVIGFSDAKTGAQPEDLQFHLRTIAAQIDRLSSTSTANEQSTVTIFPNPATDLITLESIEPINSWVIYDMMGKVILEKQLSTESLQEKVDISTLPKGIYLLKVNNNSSQKIVKN